MEIVFTVLILLLAGAGYLPIDPEYPRERSEFILADAGVPALLTQDGLLGTVAGIIHAFNAINANGLGDPRVLSGGIGEALITTAAGLTVAIPSLIAYRFLRGKVERLVIRMEKEAMKLTDALDERGGFVKRAS